MMTPDTAETQLRQELREMFLVDTQQQLELYFDIVQQLQPGSWIRDIQSIYRAIHTIKGGAVTVEANSMLYGAMALEDLLSDLRYLEVAPPLSDGKLSQILVEAGELLTGCMEIFSPGISPSVDDEQRVHLALQRLQTLHAQVKADYLPDWNEMKQVHQEFAEQGFDLVVLELEMALAKIPDRGAIPPETIEIARSTLAQLIQIGTELELAPGWTSLIQCGERAIGNPDPQLWRTIWLPYFQVLKACIKNSGEIETDRVEQLEALASAVGSKNPSPIIPVVSVTSREISPDMAIESGEDLSGLLDDFFLDEETATVAETVTFTTPSEDASDNFSIDAEISALGQSLPPEIATAEDLPDLLDIFFTEAETAPISEITAAATGFSAELVTDLWSDAEIPPASQSRLLEIESTEDLPDLLDTFFLDEETEIAAADPIPTVIPISRGNFSIAEIDALTERSALDELDLIALIESEFVATTDDRVAVPTPQSLPAPLSIAPVEAKRGISIPVPIERLDRSAQQVVDTLLTARAVKNVADRLQSQLAQLSVLTQESSQFVARLRQLQDDYALLRNLSDERDSGNNVTLERYRQGYTTIVRLLENMLRMSELGQEIETATYQSQDRLEALDRSILRLKDGIETSRLVPFRNLTQRARAILRDLTNRYGKPATLTVENEQVELDAGVVQQLEPALLHLIRNAYDHGLETAAQRLALGKPERGTIHISLTRRGNLYRLELEDDGAGIDAQSVHQIAKSKGFSLDRTSTPSELLAVLCQPGFSSSATISEVSGRGVGMDVVVAQIASMGGKISLETAVGRGTKFAIDVPAPQLLVPCVLFQVGDRTIAFPTEEVLETALLSSMSAEMSTDDDGSLCTWTLNTRQGSAPGFDLANYWQFASRSLPDTAIGIRTRQGKAGTEIWSIADDLLGQAELLINPLPSPLIAPAGLLGVSLQSDGRLISILDPIALNTKLATTTDRADYSFSTLAVEQVRPSTPTILIVDDAALMRRRFEASLHTYGFVTHTCNDGLEALNWLQTNPLPDLMITDVEMPNMDGFTLIDRARQAKIEIPILVVSSRSSEEWGKEARRLGATDYLNKGFATPELLQKVNSLLGLVVNV
ncbi:response regulator [Chamaesiphon sp.]|uniref:response regulator n=1 Tax=Chamaesiphon sp. TaxID=2814140 RepID=UPI003593FA6F